MQKPGKMYRQEKQASTSLESFKLPSEGKLAEDNRWVIMAQWIPWTEFETEYAELFSSDMGAPAQTFRMALGALIIKEKLGISERETVEQSQENPYLQYFIGQREYSNSAPFDASRLVQFRTRISAKLVKKVNQAMVKRMREATTEPSAEKQPESEEVSERKNLGKLIADATCAPADLTYPTDLKILNQAREQTEKILEILHKSGQDKSKKKPRTYRKKARKDYLEVAKQRRPSRKARRKGLKKQRQYIKRNLGHIDQLIADGAVLDCLNSKQYKSLLVVAEIYRQQQWMFDNNKQSISDRIVSLSQPHIRPIVRGQAGTPVEFGAKLSASCVDKYVFLDRISWDNFNESADLIAQIEAFKEYTGYYPKSVHVDKIYRTRENRAWCKERGIRISGPPLGRPPVNVSKETKKQALDDEKIRNSIEGKFGQGKRVFSLNRIMTKLAHTSETAIAITFLVMNLSVILREIFWSIFLFNYFFWVSDYRNLSINSLTRKKLIYHSYLIS